MERLMPLRKNNLFFTKMKYLFAYLVERQSYIERGRDTERSSSGSLPGQLKRHRLAQAKARSQELFHSLPHGCRGPNTWVITCCFPRHMAGSWDLK